MGQPSSLTREDLSVLLRIVGSRKGADFDALLDFQSSHQRKASTSDQIRESLDRLMSASLVEQQGNSYIGTPDVQAAFFSECRNCRDTFEEFDVLNRIISQFGRFEATEQDESGGNTLPPPRPGSRWRGE